MASVRCGPLWAVLKGSLAHCMFVHIYLKAKSHGACLLRKDLLWRSQRIKDLAYEEEAYYSAWIITNKQK